MPPKTQKEMLSEVYDLLVGTGEEPGLAEEIRNLIYWRNKHTEFHHALSRWFCRGAIGTATAAIGAAVTWWLKTRGI